MILVFLPNDIPCFNVADAQVERFRRLLPANADLPVVVCRTESEFTAHLPGATAVFVWSFKQEWFALAPKLRHVCTPAAGRDYFHVAPPPQVTMHYGTFHGAIMGETALACVLAVSHGILPFAREMKDGTGEDAAWPRLRLAAAARRISGATIAILGFGHIGRIFARMAKPFGPRLVGVTQSPHPEYRDEFPDVALATAGDLPAVLPEADHVVCFLPSGAATTKLLDARNLSLMKRGAFLYNFGRGNLVDEDALAAALHAGRLGGAVLDVFQAEPLPATSPLRRCPNCYLYPHASAFSPDYLDLYFEKAAAAMARAED